MNALAVLPSKGSEMARAWGLGTAAVGAVVFALNVVPSLAADPVGENDGSWPSLVSEVFQDRPIRDGSGLISLDAPMNHPDAGAIPVVIRTGAPAVGPERIRRLTLIVDENPSPVVATFDVGDAAVLQEIATTVRVNRFSYVHLVAETADGGLWAVGRYVKGSGGCSARGVELREAAEKTLGQMAFAEVARRPHADGTVERQVDVSVKHPNYTGMQQDYVTLYYIPAHFMTEMVLKQGDAPLVTIESGISVSENPHFRITYATAADGRDLTADVTDSEGLQFHRSWPLDASGS